MFGRFDPGRRQLRVRNLARTEILEELSPQSRELLPFDLHHRFAPVCDTTLCPRHLLPRGKAARRSGRSRTRYVAAPAAACVFRGCVCLATDARPRKKSCGDQVFFLVLDLVIGRFK